MTDKTDVRVKDLGWRFNFDMDIHFSVRKDDRGYYARAWSMTLDWESDRFDDPSKAEMAVREYALKAWKVTI